MLQRLRMVSQKRTERWTVSREYWNSSSTGPKELAVLLVLQRSDCKLFSRLLNRSVATLYAVQESSADCASKPLVSRKLICNRGIYARVHGSSPLVMCRPLKDRLQHCGADPRFDSIVAPNVNTFSCAFRCISPQQKQFVVLRSRLSIDAKHGADSRLFAEPPPVHLHALNIAWYGAALAWFDKKLKTVLPRPVRLCYAVMPHRRSSLPRPGKVTTAT